MKSWGQREAKRRSHSFSTSAVVIIKRTASRQQPHIAARERERKKKPIPASSEWRGGGQAEPCFTSGSSANLSACALMIFYQALSHTAIHTTDTLCTRSLFGVTVELKDDKYMWQVLFFQMHTKCDLCTIYTNSAQTDASFFLFI